MTKKLKPCPFCGGKAHTDFAPGSNITYVGKYGIKVTTPFLYRVLCEDCFTQTQAYENREHAVEAWNRRVKEKEDEN